MPDRSREDEIRAAIEAGGCPVLPSDHLDMLSDAAHGTLRDRFDWSGDWDAGPRGARMAASLRRMGLIDGGACATEAGRGYLALLEASE